MSEAQSSEPKAGEAGREQMLSALFAQLVMQQANLAMMLLGKVAHPESGQVVKDIEAARLFIDQLEMLEVKTRGNLNKEEVALLKQSLMNLRLAFVEAVESPSTQSATQPKEGGQTTEGQKASSPSAGPAHEEDEEHRKKFSKKY